MSTHYANEPLEKSKSQGIETPDFDESLVAAFERAAVTFPSRIALGSDVWEPTYRELNETANRLAHRLIACGVATGDRAAILMSHDAPMVAAVLGCLKAGQIVVSLDPGDPVARLKILVEDAEPSVIVADAQNCTKAAEFAQPGCRIVMFESETAIGPVENPSIEIPPEQTAFLTYTSGTTGPPKGVMTTHRQLLRGAAAVTEAMQYTKNDRIPLFAMVSTGQGVNGLWFLLNGAMLCPFPVKTRGVTGLADWIIDRGLTVYVSSASIFRTLVKTIDDRLVFSNVRAVRLASEPVTADDFKAFKKHFPATSILVHTLSSSETSTIAWSRWTQNADIPEGVLPVGHVSRNFDISLVDDDGQPVAQGETGEIVVRSRYVANGYWRNPELTAARFSADLDGKGTRLVRTGDLGRINADGLLELRGRKDDRIKIRGNRIELAEIEQVLQKLPGIDRAAVVAVPRENHEPLLVAFVVKTDNASWTVQRLRQAVRANLPLHMAPSRIVFLDGLPHNRGNKIDREALRQQNIPARDGSKGEQPRTETEMLLADVWADILELPEIGRDDDFFSLGGDSLRGAVMAAQVHTALGIELSLGAIADHPTLSTLAAFLETCQRTATACIPPIIRVPRAAAMPLSFFQEAYWNGLRGQAHVRSYRVIGPLDVEALKECLRYLIDRHEILRTTFGVLEGCPVQIIHPSAPLGFSFIDLIDADDAEGQAETIIRDEASREIDLEKLPIKRHMLIRIANNNYRLIRISHSLIADGGASQILDAELATLYEARLQGKDPFLPKKPPLQYADYAVWQRQVMGPGSPYFTAAVVWWKNLFSPAPPATKLPFTRLRRADLDPSEGVLRWALEERTAQRLEEIARGAGATHFIVRLAAFAALIADVTGKTSVVIGTHFSNRNRIETQNIVGLFLDTAPFVFSYDTRKTFLEWLEIVRDRVFETTMRGELPYDKIRERLQASGMELPEIRIVFMMASDHSDRKFGNLAISDEFWGVGTMPWGCTVYVDERKPENCRVNFNANYYDRNGMRAMLDRYLGLLEAAAREPELPIGTLLTMTGAKPLRWKCEPFYEFVKAFYDAAPVLKMLWRPVKSWVSSSGRS